VLRTERGRVSRMAPLAHGHQQLGAKDDQLLLVAGFGIFFRIFHYNKNFFTYYINFVLEENWENIAKIKNN
jgi:hypothetical protein